MSLIDLEPAVQAPAQCAVPASAPHAVDLQPGNLREGETLLCLRPAHGRADRTVRVAWRLHGPADAPCIAVLGGISADRRVADAAGVPGWWQEQTVRDGALDVTRWRLLSCDWLDAETLDAEAVDSSDQAQALAGVLDALGIARLHALVGASYGAMVGLAFAALFPVRLRRLVAIAGAHRAHPQAAALRAVQRGIVRFALDRGDAARGLALARQLAMIGYRSPRELARRFAAPAVLAAGRVRVGAEDWLEAAGARFAQRFDAQRFLALSESIDLHAVDPAAVRVPTTLIGFSTDQLVPVADLCALQRGLGAPCELHVLDSEYGHDAFLKETGALGALLRAALAQAGGHG
jgi:homoserine O-acetyltransferase